MKPGVLLVGFGGPTRAEDIRPFLSNVLRGRPVPPHRVDEVVKQYERIGGRSPYNELVGDLSRALSARLQSDGVDLPVYTGMRNWSPTLAAALKNAAEDGVTDLVAVPLAAFRSIPSWNYYLKSTAEAHRAARRRPMRLHFVQPWHAHPAFRDAVADRVAEALRAAPNPPGNDRWWFTAHSIPTPWDAASGYSGQLKALAEAVAARFGVSDFRLVYQSRSGRPEDPWLDPDISDALARNPGAGRRAVVIPIGFLMDHVEVLFDLDVRARETGHAHGWDYLRAKTVGDHPRFVALLSALVQERLRIAANRPAGPGPSRRFVVVGGGAAGLSAAHRAVELSARRGEPLDLAVLESRPRAGGVIETGRSDGFLWESGPDSFITEKPALLNLAERLGLSGQIIGTNPSFQKSFVALRGRLHSTPEGFYLLAPSRLRPLIRTPLLTLWGKFRAALELVIPPRRSPGDESLASFVRRRFGREVLERLAQPMVAGIYSADPEKLSLRATFPRFLEMEARGGVIRSLLRARWKKSAGKGAVPARGTSGPRYGLFATFRDGLDTFVDALRAELPPTALRTGVEVRSVDKIGGGWRLTLASGERLETPAVCLAVSAPVAARLLRPVDPVLATLLEGIPFGDVATVNLAYPRSSVRHALDGFGFVVPGLEGRAVTGCTFCHVKFDGRAPRDRVLFRAFVGGEALRLSDAELLNRVRGDLRDYLGAEGEPLFAHLRRYPAAMPQYGLGHLERVAAIFDRLKRFHPGLTLAGNSYGGIGLPDAVASGESAAETALRPGRPAPVPESVA